MPTLETEIWQEYEDDGLVGIALSSNTIGTDDPETLGDFVEAMGLTMLVLVDYDVSTYPAYALSCGDSFAPYPRELIIDREGTILYTSCTIDVDEIRAVLDANL